MPSFSTYGIIPTIFGWSALVLTKGLTVKAGAKFVVTGNVLKKEESKDLIKEFASAIHVR